MFFIGGTIRKYCLDMAFQTDFKYLEDVISSFTWVPNDSDLGCKKLELGSSEKNENDFLKVCICNDRPCNNGSKISPSTTIGLMIAIMIIIIALVYKL